MEDNKECCGQHGHKKENGCCGEHKHKHDGGCQSGNCGNHEEYEEPVIYVTFEDEDKEVACDVLDIFSYKEREYIVLSPQDEDEVLIYRYSETDEGVDLSEIETDEEYEEVSEIFSDMFFDEVDEDGEIIEIEE